MSEDKMDLYQRLMRKPSYRKDLEKQKGSMPWQKAVPNTRDITQRHASTMAREDLEGERFQTRLGLGERRFGLGEQQYDLEKRRLGLSESLHTDERGLAKERLGHARSQGRLATGISLANVGLQGLAGVLQIKEADKKVQMINDMKQMYFDDGDMDNYYNAQFLSIFFGGK